MTNEEIKEIIEKHQHCIVLSPETKLLIIEVKMSELNVYHHELRPNEYAEFYLKYEADKVIAEKDAEIAELKGQVNGFQNRSNLWHYNAVEEHKKFVQAGAVIAELKADYKEACGRLQTADLIKDEQLEAARHHKYRRCLDNAWGCHQRMELFHELVLQEARTIALPNEKALKEYRSKRERAAKWRKRWLKIAEKFKEAK